MANILMIVPELNCGGGLQKISLQLSQKLIERGHSIIIVDENNPLDAYLQEFELNNKFLKIEAFECKEENYNFFSQIIKDYNIDLIIYQGFYKKISCFLEGWKRKNNTRIISVFHNSPDCILPKGISSLSKDTKGVIKAAVYPLYYAYSKIKVKEFLIRPYKFSDKIILLSHTFIPIYKSLTGVSQKISVIPNFIDGKNSGLSIARKKQIIYIGRLEEQAKKVSRIMKIWEKISIINPEWKLIIAGEGSYRQEYENYAIKHAIRGVEFAGYISNPSNLYAESSILLMTSDFEGFPMVLIEGMSNGCVPIAYKSFASVTDIIDDGNNGVLVTPFKENEYITKLLSLMNNEEYLAKLSFNSMMKANEFSSKQIIPLWNEVIEEVVNK